MRGTAHVFGDEVNTDVITPSDYFGESLTVMAEHIFEPERPKFSSAIDVGDIVVAGDHFGSGSSRESAPAAIQAAGIGAVVAESFARLFYRNAIGIGLPVVTCPDITDGVSEGHELVVDLDVGLVQNRTTGETFESESLPPELQSILDRGGLIELYRSAPDGSRLG